MLSVLENAFLLLWSVPLLLATTPPAQSFSIVTAAQDPFPAWINLAGLRCKEDVSLLNVLNDVTAFHTQVSKHIADGRCFPAPPVQQERERDSLIAITAATSGLQPYLIAQGGPSLDGQYHYGFGISGRPEGVTSGDFTSFIDGSDDGRCDFVTEATQYQCASRLLAGSVTGANKNYQLQRGSHVLQLGYIDQSGGANKPALFIDPYHLNDLDPFYADGGTATVVGTDGANGGGNGNGAAVTPMVTLTSTPSGASSSSSTVRVTPPSIGTPSVSIGGQASSSTTGGSTSTPPAVNSTTGKGDSATKIHFPASAMLGLFIATSLALAAVL